MGESVNSKVECSNSTRPSAVPQGNFALSTPAQVKLIYLTATRELHITEEQMEQRCQEQFGRLPIHLTKKEASEFIDRLKSVGGRNGK